jgi:5-carboxymethyl-2-hydroxymuconate isomerase
MLKAIKLGNRAMQKKNVPKSLCRVIATDFRLLKSQQYLLLSLQMTVSPGGSIDVVAVSGCVGVVIIILF